MTEEYWQRDEMLAVENLSKLLEMPMPSYRDDIGGSEFFDPWLLFPSIYGSYDSKFDKCAIHVLDELLFNYKTRDDLGAEMIREMLCKLDLCSYGTSPRVCFPNEGFKKLLPALIEKWKAYTFLYWEVNIFSQKSPPSS